MDKPWAQYVLNHQNFNECIFECLFWLAFKSIQEAGSFERNTKQKTNTDVYIRRLTMAVWITLRMCVCDAAATTADSVH